MIRAFLHHHYQRARNGQITNALTNCHAVGLHSIVLHDEPANRVRMFVANYDHQLWDGDGNPALAVHAHHCNVRLQRIFGKVTNWNYSDIRPSDGPYEVCAYDSGVTETSALRGLGVRFSFDSICLEPLEDEIYLHARAMHTVTVPRGAQAAWLVFEGSEDSAYAKQCYSLAPEKFDPDPLYKPMSAFDIETYLGLCLLRLDERLETQ